MEGNFHKVYFPKRIKNPFKNNVEKMNHFHNGFSFASLFDDMQYTQGKIKDYYGRGNDVKKTINSFFCFLG